MSEMEQLKLFHFPKTDLDDMNGELEQVIEKLDRYRKSMHARLSSISSNQRACESRIDFLEMQFFTMQEFFRKYIENQLDQSCSTCENCSEIHAT